MLVLSIVALLLVLLALGVPVALALALSGAIGLYAIGGPPMMLGILSTSPLSTPASYELITIPMFMLMAEFVVISGIAQDLFRAASIWVGRVPGGLGIATALAGAGFGAISGSSTAAAATLSNTSIPAMLEQGYEPKLACGAVAISGTLAMLIPPSIALILYGLIADLSIGKLLVAGIIPGILVMLTIALTIFLLAILHPEHAPPAGRYTLAEKFASLRVVGPMALLIMMVTGIIYLGVATPTEAAALGAFGAMVLAVAQRKLSWETLGQALWRAASTTAMVMFIILGATIFGYFITITQLTREIVTWVGDLDVPRLVILLMVLAGYFVLACFLDQVAILILTVPIVLPMMTSLGYDPIWFGVLIIVLAEVGLVTPPVGLNVFVVSRYTGRPLEEVFLGAVPHVFAHLFLLALLIIFPSLILWLPSTMMTN